MPSLVSLHHNRIDATGAVGDSVVQRSTEATYPTKDGVPAAAPMGKVANPVNDVLNSSVNGAQSAPVESPMTWTLLAFVWREFAAAADRLPTVDPLAGQTTAALTQPTVTWPPAEFTGQPSLVSEVFSAAFRLVGDVGNALHVDITIPLSRLLTSAHPPRLTTRGLDVQRSEFDGMPVWALHVADPSGKDVVAIHGGGVTQPLIFNWLDYAAIARDTGATVIVPIYPLVGRGGTAATIVPTMADLISVQIDQQGADNVSVFGDSAGGEMALAAVEELVRSGDPVPSHMVLSSPVLDESWTNPVIPLTNDPIFAHLLPVLQKSAQEYADGLSLTDPLVSPLYGSLAGLPPTTVYAGSDDVTAPDIVALQQKVSVTPGADFTFVLRKGEPHDWAIVTILPETKAVLPDMYRQLGIAPDA